MSTTPSILATIAGHKREEVARNQELYPIKLLEKSIFFDTPVVSLKKYLLRPDLCGILAEFKRKSPSKGFINEFANVETVSVGYMQAGASALSILTDATFFGGSNAHLTAARRLNFCPILRKDFILDEYQIMEAKSIGADAILLIAAMLTPTETANLASFAKRLGLEVLLEIHDHDELERSPLEHVDVVGINNRDLATFHVDLNTSYRLAGQLPEGMVRITESGIDNVQDCVALRQAGFNGFLIGEAFMKHSRPEKACQAFVNELKLRLTPLAETATILMS